MGTAEAALPGLGAPVCARVLEQRCTVGVTRAPVLAGGMRHDGCCVSAFKSY